MAADAFGNDITAVGVPITGFFGFAPSGTTIPTSSQGAQPTAVLDAAFKKAGLITQDGGFNWTLEADGDPIEFFQDGYYLPSGLANATLVVKLAQYDNNIRGLLYDGVPDGNGFLTIDGSGTTDRFALFTEEIFKNGMIRRRVAADAGITNVVQDQSERGAENGVEVTFKVARSAQLGNKHIGEWLLPVGSATVPLVGTATSTPAAQVAGGLVVITGSNFTGATNVKFGTVSVSTGGFTVQSDGVINAIMPPGSAGSAPVTVINAAGTSNAVAYTRGA